MGGEMKEFKWLVGARVPKQILTMGESSVLLNCYWPTAPREFETCVLFWASKLLLVSDIDSSFASVVEDLRLVFRASSTEELRKVGVR